MDTSDTSNRNYAKNISEFCESRRISRSTYYEIRKLGLGPATFNIPGLRLEQVTSQAEAEWDERMLELAKSEAAQIEAERRRELATIAGRAAAQSPKHISRRKTSKPDRAQRRRRGWR